MIHFEIQQCSHFSQIYVQMWYQVSQIPMQIENQWLLMVEGKGDCWHEECGKKARKLKGKYWCHTGRDRVGEIIQEQWTTIYWKLWYKYNMLPNSVSCWPENVPSLVMVLLQLYIEMSVESQIATKLTTLLSLKSSSFTGITGPHIQALVHLCQKGPVGKWDIEGVLPVLL